MKKFLFVLVLLAAAYIYWGPGHYGRTWLEAVRDNLSAPATPTTPSEPLGPSSGASAADIAASASYKYTEKYTDPDDRFSFRYPKGFVVTVLPVEAAPPQAPSDIFILANPAAHIGLQLIVTSITPATSTKTAEPIVISQKFVHDQLPTLAMADATIINFPDDSRHDKALFFSSDNAAFAGHSAEIWFLNKDQLYQLTTYAEFAPFLRSIFSTLVLK